MLGFYSYKITRNKNYDISLSLSAMTLLIADATKGASIDRFATQGGTIRLLCDLPISADPDVEWVDVVYGSEWNPERIFSSASNPDFDVAETHKNRGNFQVDRDFALTISNLDMESDVGQFTCKSRTESGLHQRKYYVTIGGYRCRLFSSKLFHFCPQSLH